MPAATKALEGEDMDGNDVEVALALGPGIRSRRSFRNARL